MCIRDSYYDTEHPEAVKKGHEDEQRYSYNQAHLPVREQDEAVGHAAVSYTHLPLSLEEPEETKRKKRVSPCWIIFLKCTGYSEIDKSFIFHYIINDLYKASFVSGRRRCV